MKFSDITYLNIICLFLLFETDINLYVHFFFWLHAFFYLLVSFPWKSLLNFLDIGALFYIVYYFLSRWLYFRNFYVFFLFIESRFFIIQYILITVFQPFIQFHSTSPCVQVNFFFCLIRKEQVLKDNSKL